MTTEELKVWAEEPAHKGGVIEEMSAAVLALIAERDEARKQASVAKGASNYEAKRAEAAEAKLAEAQKAWRESRGPLTAALDRLKELEAKLAELPVKEAGEVARAVARAAASEARVEALREALLPFIEQRRCAKGVRMEGDCLQAKDPKPCRICAARAALAAGRKP